MRKFIALLLVAAILCPLWAPRAEAFEPVTMMVLAPIALKVAEAARPHLEKCIISTGQGVFKIGKAAFHLIYLPWGILEMTFGAPFGKFSTGLKHTIRGGLFAPIRLFSYTLLLPLYMVGAEINI